MRTAKTPITMSEIEAGIQEVGGTLSDLQRLMDRSASVYEMKGEFTRIAAAAVAKLTALSGKVKAVRDPAAAVRTIKSAPGTRKDRDAAVGLATRLLLDPGRGD